MLGTHSEPRRGQTSPGAGLQWRQGGQLPPLSFYLYENLFEN